MSKTILFHSCEECKRGISQRHSQESEKSVGVSLCRSCWTMSDEYIGPDCFLLDLDCLIATMLYLGLDTQRLFSFSGELVKDQLLDCCRQIREKLQRLTENFPDILRVIQNIENDVEC
jgi:hypothetical protein